MHRPPHRAPQAPSQPAHPKAQEPPERAEKALRRRILTSFSNQPDVLILCNEANLFATMLNFIPQERHNQVFRSVLEEERYGLGIGSPDLIAIVRGLFLGLEVKRPKGPWEAQGEQSPSQKEWEAIASARMVPYHVVRSVEEAHWAVDKIRQRAIALGLRAPEVGL